VGLFSFSPFLEKENRMRKEKMEEREIIKNIKMDNKSKMTYTAI